MHQKSTKRDCLSQVNLRSVVEYATRDTNDATAVCAKKLKFMMQLIVKRG